MTRSMGRGVYRGTPFCWETMRIGRCWLFACGIQWLRAIGGFPGNASKHPSNVGSFETGTRRLPHAMLNTGSTTTTTTRIQT